MTGIPWKELFPTKLSLVVFILYILLFVNQGILVTASQGSNKEYAYNIVTVVLMTEIFKLIASVVLYCRSNSPTSLLREIAESKKVLLLYFVPAFLYCLYNNLSFVNLSFFDPTTYYLLLQFRIVITAILFQFIFKKQLSSKQWLSLVILTVGCMLKQVNFTKDSTDSITPNETSNKPLSTEFFSINLIFILVQTLCSCLAGVYNEYLLKKTGADVNIFVQNVYMYLDSIICNATILLLQGNLHGAFTFESLEKVFHYKVLLVMINNAAVGIITSFFLKTLNSILKTFASALELVLTAIMCYFLFSIPIYLNTIIALVMVLFAIYLYSQSPVNNVQPEVKQAKHEEEELLMEEV